jgi:hypothetical protein
MRAWPSLKWCHGYLGHDGTKVKNDEHAFCCRCNVLHQTACYLIPYRQSKTVKGGKGSHYSSVSWCGGGDSNDRKKRGHLYIFMFSDCTSKLACKLYVWHKKLRNDSVAYPDPRSGAFLTPRSGSGIRNWKKTRAIIRHPGWTSRILFENLIPFNFFGLKILKSFDADPGSGILSILDPVSRMEEIGSGIRHKFPGSATMINEKSSEIVHM